MISEFIFHILIIMYNWNHETQGVRNYPGMQKPVTGTVPWDEDNFLNLQTGRIVMHAYYKIPAEGLGKGAKIPLPVLGDSGEVFYELALEMTDEIKRNNAKGKNTVMICPVGPVGQYPIFTRLVNEQQISLKNCWFINMDESLTDEDEYIDEGSPLSFRSFMNRQVYSRINKELLMPAEQRIFPDPRHPEAIQELIGMLGGVDLAAGRSPDGSPTWRCSLKPTATAPSNSARSSRTDLLFPIHSFGEAAAD